MTLALEALPSLESLALESLTSSETLLSSAKALLPSPFASVTSMASLAPVAIAGAAAGAAVSFTFLPSSLLALLARSSSEVIHTSSEALGTDASMAVAVSARNGHTASIHST
jgi:hypothetical protein